MAEGAALFRPTRSLRIELKEFFDGDSEYLGDFFEGFKCEV